MVAGLAEEEVAIGPQPAEQFGEEVAEFSILEVHQQPVGEHQVVAAQFTQAPHQPIKSK